MQRAPCSCSSAIGSSTTNSLKSSTRWSLGRLRGSTRSIFRKPPSSPIPGEHLLLGLLLGLGLLGVARAGIAGGLARALGRLCGVLVLPGLADLARLLVAVPAVVGRGLTGAHGAAPVAIAVLGDHRRLAGLDRGP